ncbi:MAG: LacI family transcriptional regulator [Clostridiaceae bacterium]|jgi:LacI family transcriptional regulator|nr:LacI family transcriptional regulator [Clostridiaceae bacterium]
MAKKVSMEDIAKKLGISKNTVSLAMRNMPLISAKTRELVHHTAMEMGYVYKRRASTQGLNKTFFENICLLVPRIIRNIEFFSLIQFGIEKEARKHNLNIILHYVDENDFELPSCITENMVDGIIMLGCLPKELTVMVSASELPIVSVDNYYDDISMNYVLTDNISGSFNMTEYLIKRGHKKIGFYGNINIASSFYDRYLGYYKASLEHGLKIPEEWIIKNNLSDYTGLLNHLKTGKADLPSAFVCVNDVHALRLINALEEISVHVPGNVSVAGFDNIPQSGENKPGLTTMHVYKEALGEAAVMRLISIPENEQLPEKILILTKLVERESVSSVKNKVF